MNLQGNVGQITSGLLQGKILKAASQYIDSSKLETAGSRVKSLLAARDAQKDLRKISEYRTITDEIIAKPGGEDITLDEAIKGGLIK